MQLCIEQLLYKISLFILFVCFFFCLANIYGPTLGKVGLGRPNPNHSKSLIFISEEEKNILLRIVCTTTFHRPIFNFYFYLLLKNYFKKCIKRPVKMFNYIYIYIIIHYIYFLKIRPRNIVVKSLLMSTQFISPRCDV